MDDNILVCNPVFSAAGIIDTAGQIILSSHCSESCTRNDKPSQGDVPNDGIGVSVSTTESSATPNSSKDLVSSSSAKRGTSGRKRRTIDSNNTYKVADGKSIPHPKRIKQDSSFCDEEQQNGENWVETIGLHNSTPGSQRSSLSKLRGSARIRPNKKMPTAPNPQLTPSIHVSRFDKEEWSCFAELTDAFVQGTALLEELADVVLSLGT